MTESANNRLISLRPCTLVFIVLVVLTLVTWAIGTAGLGGIGVSLLVFAFALLKVQLIGDYFMQLKSINGFWRWTITIWLLIPGILVSVAFLLSATG